MDALYRAEIIEHYKHPHHYGHLENPDIVFHDVNTSCGDELTMEFKIEDGKIADVRFTGKGCAISQASASMLTDEIIGMSVEEAEKLDKDFILDMLGIDVGPTRLKCALLSLKVLKGGLYGLGSVNKTEEDKSAE